MTYFQENQKDMTIDILLEEYKALRQEIIESLKARYSLLVIGIAAIGIIVNASQSANFTKVFKVLGIFGSQLFCLLVLLFWFGEYMRGQNAGAFLAALEKRINTANGNEQLLSWETSLREKRGRKHLDLTVTPLLALSLLFFFLALASIFFLFTCRSTILLIIGITIFLVGVKVHFCIHRYILRRMEKIRSKTSN